MTDTHTEPKAPLAKRLTGLVCGIAFIWVFMFVLAPYFESKPYIKPLVDFIEYRNIDASALYYTEIEEFATAGLFMDNSRSYNPNNHGQAP